MSKYAGMSVERSIAELAYDEGQKQLRDEAIDKVASKMFKKAMNEKVMPDGQTVGEFLCCETDIAKLLNEFDLKYLHADGNRYVFYKLHTLAYDLIANECNQAAEDEVDEN